MSYKVGDKITFETVPGPDDPGYHEHRERALGQAVVKFHHNKEKLEKIISSTKEILSSLHGSISVIEKERVLTAFEQQIKVAIDVATELLEGA